MKEQVEAFMCEFMRAVQAAFPPPHKKHSVNIYFADGLFRYSCRVDSLITGKYMYLPLGHELKDEYAQDIDQAIDLCRRSLAVADAYASMPKKKGKKIVEPVEEVPVKQIDDTAVLKEIFANGPLGYRELIYTGKDLIPCGQNKMRGHLQRWIREGKVLKVGLDRAPETKYHLNITL